MPERELVVVYDILATSAFEPALSVPLLVLLVGVGVSVHILMRERRAGRRVAVVFELLGLVFWVGVTGLVWTSQLLSHWRAREWLRSGHVAIAEGPVRNFVPMPYEGHANESFDVGDAHFEYSDFKLEPGFTNAASHGGPIREGLWVRIAHHGHYILRLEIERPADKR